MKIKLLPFLLISYIIACTNQQESQSQENKENIMNARFFTTDEFNDNFSKEMMLSQDVYKNMKKSGLVDYQLCKFDFDFVSNNKENLDSLKSFLETNYGYTVKQPKKEENQWILWGEATEYQVDGDNMLYWAINLYFQGYKYDSKLSGYGATVDTPKFLDISPSTFDSYFDKALDCYNNGDLGGAIINWSTCIKINPDDPNSYYSRAIVKDELFTWKSALRDYDKAIEIAPNFVDALVNRGSSRDESGNYIGAIEDYSKVIELEPKNSNAFLNRGNSNFNLGKTDLACEDWTKASELGDETATKRLKEKCK